MGPNPDQPPAERVRTQTMLDLVEIVDDVDRAVEMANSASDRQQIATGLEQLRRGLLHRFSAAGLRPFCQVGDEFDPRFHEAIHAEPSIGPDNVILRVHRRGWVHPDNTMARAATVTVSKGHPQPAAEPVTADPSQAAAAAASGYVCPYGTPGCQGDCPHCELARQIHESEVIR